MIDVGWIAVIVAFSVGTLIGMAVTAVLSMSWTMAAFRRGMAEGERIHHWGRTHD